MKEESVYPKEDKIFDFCGAGYSGTFMMNTIHPCFSESDALSDVPGGADAFFMRKGEVWKRRIFFVMKTTVLTFWKMKRQGEKISMLTCYDYTTARLMDGTVDGILVGDSYGNTMLGYDSTLPVTMDHLIAATQGVEPGGVRYAVHVVSGFGGAGAGERRPGAQGDRMPGGEVGRRRVGVPADCGAEPCGNSGGGAYRADPAVGKCSRRKPGAGKDRGSGGAID